MRRFFRDLRYFLTPPGCPPGAHRAAAFFGPSPGIDGGFPYMPQVTLPPHLSVGSCRHHLRRQRPVQGRMPLLCHFRLFGGQIIEAGQHFPPATVGAPAATYRAGRYRRTICMPQITSPPDLPICLRGDLPWRQAFVSCRMPLSGNIRKSVCKAVLPLNDLFPGTERTTAVVVRSRGHAGLPFMSFLTSPPDLPPGAG